LSAANSQRENAPMRCLNSLLAGLFLLLYVQAVCLPLELLLSCLGPDAAENVCRCKLTGQHNPWCRCPCCAEGPDTAGAAAKDACCSRKQTAEDPCYLPAGCGASHSGPTVDARGFPLHLGRAEIGLEIPARTDRRIDWPGQVPYSVIPALPDKIPL
jgi:hypothetical protein